MNYPLQVYVLNSFLEKDKKWADSLSAAESSSDNELTSLLCNTFLPSSTRVQNSISDVRIALLFTGWNVRLQFFSVNEPSLMCDRVDQLVMLFGGVFFSYICKGCNLFSLLLSSFHFCSHVFPFLTVSSFKHARVLNVWKFIYSRLWYHLVRKTLPFPLLTLLEIVIETKLRLM